MEHDPCCEISSERTRGEERYLTRPPVLQINWINVNKAKPDLLPCLNIGRAEDQREHDSIEPGKNIQIADWQKEGGKMTQRDDEPGRK